jgi:glc operon protein GlcG
MFRSRFALVLVGLFAAAPSAPAQEKKPLVTRDRVLLNLAGAETVLEAAKKKAAAMALKCNIAVVDDGGHLLSFARMDGARPASGATALTKAVSAATFRQETGPLPAKGEPDVLLSLGLQNAAAASGGKITTLKGGVPIVVDGQIIGAIGVGGGTGEQDVEVAKAGVQALLDGLGEKK